MENLLTPITKESEQHPNFKNILTNGYRKERSLLESWVANFPDRDNKFIHEFQTTFNSSFWEIYLHKLLEDLDLTVDYSRQAPDFFINNTNNTFSIEAVISNNNSLTPAEYTRLDNLKKRN